MAAGGSSTTAAITLLLPQLYAAIGQILAPIQVSHAFIAGVVAIATHNVTSNKRNNSTSLRVRQCCNRDGSGMARGAGRGNTDAGQTTPHKRKALTLLIADLHRANVETLCFDPGTDWFGGQQVPISDLMALAESLR